MIFWLWYTGTLCDFANGTLVLWYFRMFANDAATRLKNEKERLCYSLRVFALFAPSVCAIRCQSYNNNNPDSL